MKTAFFLVLLANLTLLMYEYHRGAFDRTAEAPAPDARMLREPIVLAGEQESKSAPAAQAALAKPTPGPGEKEKTMTAAPEAATPPPARQTESFACYEAGPFANVQIFDAWSKAVNEVEVDVKPIMHDAPEVIGYLVLYPTAGGAEEMRVAMQTLRDQGLTDVWPLATGEYKGYISLGTFRRENRAVDLQKDLQDKGIESVVKPRLKEVKQRYALVTAPGTSVGLFKDLGQKYPNIQLKSLPDDDPTCLESRSVKSSPPMAEKAMPAQQAVVSEDHVMPVIDRATPHDNVGKPVCYEAGPFTDEQSLSVWQKQVAGAQGRMKIVFRENQVINDYLVLYPSSGGVEATQAALHMLHERGLEDAWPLPAGEQKGQISLGVFNREENALQMQKSLSDKGVDSVVSPRYKSKQQKYALIAGAESIVGKLQALEKSHPDIKLRKLADAEQNCSKDNAVMP